MTKTKFNIKELVKKIERLAELRSQLIASGIAPLGAWIHEYTIRRHSKNGVEEYYYIKWQASDPIFKRNPKKNALPIKKNKNSQYTCHQHNCYRDFC